MSHLLLRRGADPGRADGRGEAPLHAAAERGDAAFVALLLDRGAAVDAQTAEGQTPLFLAAQVRRG